MRRAPAIGLVMGWLTIALVWHGSATGADAPLPIASRFQQANERYRNGQFEEAASAYRRLLQAGVENGALYYNLGNAFLKSGKNGEALWAYLKAKALLPRDADVRANVAYVQSLLQPGVNASVTPSRVIRWLSFGQWLASSELAGWSALWLWVMALLLSLSTWKPQSRRVTAPLAWCSGMIAAVFLVALVVQTVWVDAMPTAVVVRKPVEVTYAPQATGTTYFTLPEGTIVKVLRQEFGWVQLQRADGLSGWASEDALNRL